MKRLFAALLLAVVAVSVACGDDDSADSTPTGSTAPGTATLAPLEASLFSIVLQPSDLPEGLDAGAPDFATNEDLAGPNPEELQRLIDVGRQLSVDMQYIPTDRLEDDSPLRGGLQTTASVYTQPEGASETFRQTETEARANDWQANYPNIKDLVVSEVEEPIADESLWLRLAGTAECTLVVTPTPDISGNIPSPTCSETKRLFIDNVIFRSGRVRGYLQVTTLFPPDAADDSFVDQIKEWADLVSQRAQTAFPS